MFAKLKKSPSNAPSLGCLRRSMSSLRGLNSLCSLRGLYSDVWGGATCQDAQGSNRTLECVHLRQVAFQ